MKVANLKGRQTSCLAILAVLSSLPTAAWPQAASSTSAAGLSPTGTRAQNDAPSRRTGADAKDALAGDPRLDVKVTLHRRNATVTDILEALTKATHVKLTAAGGEVVNSPLSVFTDNTPLRNVLDGLAHVQDLEWVRRPDKALELHPRPRRDQWDGVRPRTEAQAEQYQQGRQFFSLLPSCTPAMRTALTDMHQNGVTFGSLPPEMQKTVESMLLAVTPSLTARGQTHVPSLEDSTIRLQHTSHQDWGNSYSVDVFDGHTYVGLDFPMFDDPNENTDQVVPVAEMMKRTPWYGASEDAASRQEITQNATRLKRLQVPVTLDLHDVPLANCLEALASETGLGFVADVGKTRTPQAGWVTVRKSAAVSQKPLTDVLDQLAALYGQTWGQTESGMIVFHPAPEKPASGRIAIGDTNKP